MKQIDRLLTKAKRISRSRGEKPIVAIIERKGDFWASTVHFWRGVLGLAPNIKTSAHATAEDAEADLRSNFGSFDDSEDMTVIIDDLG